MKSRRTRQAIRTERVRRLRIEPLEERRVLDAGVAAAPGTDELPWHNSVHRLDVNNDGITNTQDLLAIINRVNDDDQEIGPLPVPPLETVTKFYDTSGDNRLTATDLQRVINGLLTPPVVEVTSLTPFTIDVTPQVTIKVTPRGVGKVPNGTPVVLDVDRNNDGDFSDANEFGQSQSTTYNGQSTFEITPALERREQLYSVRIRARVMNDDAVLGISEPLPLVVDTLTSNALADYVSKPDPSYTWDVRRTADGTIPTLGSFTYYAIDMTSQTWRSAADVNKPVWRHWVEVYVPSGPVSNTAIMLIDGGSNRDFETLPGPINELAIASLSLGSVFVNLKVVPNEPVIFTDETIERTEDAIIAYSFDKFLEGIGDPGNETWPLLMAMTKSAVRAMDTIQTFIPDAKPGSTISDFVVTGYSKRGWTTWLTAAVDDRVRAIIPGVFDNLNQGPQMVHHYGAYGFFSEAVQPYNDMQIFDRILTPEAMQLSRITDPYRYLANGRFDNMPKLLINSAGDEFFVSDSAQFYYDDIPGEQNYLLYLPNTGHGLDYELGLDSQVLKSTLTFVDAVLNNRQLPKYSWTVGQDGAIRVETQSMPTEVRLWWADNPTKRDFRDLFTNTNWQSQVLNPTSPGVYLGDVAMPNQGARAYFVQVTFPNNTVSSNDYLKSPYVFTTEVRVKSPLALHDWPFETAFSLASGAGASAAALANPSDPLRSAAASGIAILQDSLVEGQMQASAAVPLASLLPPPKAQVEAAASLLEDEEIEWYGTEDAADDLIDDLVSSTVGELIA